MARPLRLEFSGALWHVTSRGNEQRPIFADDEDRTRFLEVLDRVTTMFRWRLYAYVLMGNHYHLLLETQEPNLAAGMRQLNGITTQAFNRRHRRTGHLLQGRYKAILVERERHLLELVRYLALNPVRAGLVKSAGEWAWSSYRATAGLRPAPGWLETAWTLAQFGGAKAASRERFRRFVAEGKGAVYAPWEEVVGQVFLGGEGFRQEVRRLLGGRPRSGEIPRRQRDLARPELEAIVRAAAKEFGVEAKAIRRKRGGPVRLAVAYVARREGARPIALIGDFLGVKSWSASHMAAAGERLCETDRRFREQVRRLVAALG